MVMKMKKNLEVIDRQKRLNHGKRAVPSSKCRQFNSMRGRIGKGKSKKLSVEIRYKLRTEIPFVQLNQAKF